MLKRGQKSRWSGAALTALLHWAVVGAGQAAITPFVTSGEQVPGFAAGTRFSSFQPVGFDSDGSITFDAATTDQPQQSDIWVGSSYQNLRPVVRIGTQAPGTPSGFIFSDLRTFAIDRSDPENRIEFTGTLYDSNATPPTFQSYGVWVTDAASQPHLLARFGSPAPGWPAGTNFESAFAQGVYHGVGLVFGEIREASGDLNIGVYAGTSSADLRPILVLGRPLPGATTGSSVTGVGSVLQGADRTIVSATLSDGTNGVWASSERGIEPIALDGQLGPDGTIITSPTFGGRDSDHLLISGFMSTNSGIQPGYLFYSGTTKDDLKLVLRPDGPVPGAPGAHWTFAGPHDHPAALINRSDEVALMEPFQAQSGDYRKGIWLGSSPADMHLIAVEGANAPGAGATTKYFSFGTIGFWCGLRLNEAGQLAFQSLLSDDGQTPSGTGVFAYDPSVGTFLVTRTGDEIEFAPGVIKTVNSASVVDLNNSDQLLLWASFTDGSSGIFEATVPEPAGCALLIILNAALWRFRR